MQPLYTEQDLIADDSLLGSWEDKEANETWSFIKAGRLEYKLWHTDADGRTGEFTARLVKIESEIFIDFVPSKPAPANTDLYRGQLLPMHSFARLSKKGDVIEVSVLEMNWLKDFVNENGAAIRHERVNGDVVFTSSPKETQKFLLDHLATPGAFSKPSRLTRKRSS